MTKLPPVFSGVVHKIVAKGNFTAILTKESSVSERKPTASSFCLQKLFNNPETFPDMEFTLADKDDEVICYAHKSILCQQTDYFRAMLQADMKETNQKKFPVHFSKEVFLKVMKFVYGLELDDTGDVDPNVLPDLFDAAEFYQLEGLKAWCCEAMEGSLSFENVGSILQNVFARGDRFQPLEAVCLDFLSEDGKLWAEESKYTDSITDPKLWAKIYRATFT